jgi:Reverse transcriptase (RNA-dependent DNA polymerase)
MNHHGLFVKLMKRHIPTQLLIIFEKWFANAFTCVKWGLHFSVFFKPDCGIRQGGVLSPYLFAIYIDNIVESIINSSLGCHVRGMCVSVILYADDIVLLAPSIDALQKLIFLCENELCLLDMAINVKNLYVCVLGHVSMLIALMLAPVMVIKYSGPIACAILVFMYLLHVTLNVT